MDEKFGKLCGDYKEPCGSKRCTQDAQLEFFKLLLDDRDSI